MSFSGPFKRYVNLKTTLQTLLLAGQFFSCRNTKPLGTISLIAYIFISPSSTFTTSTNYLAASSSSYTVENVTSISLSFTTAQAILTTEVHNTLIENSITKSTRRKYLTLNYMSGMRGGLGIRPFHYTQTWLGNKVFELLSTIGLARTLGRTPYIHISNPLLIYAMSTAIREQFPQLEDQFEVVYWKVCLPFCYWEQSFQVSERVVSFNEGKCCVFDSPERLENIRDDYLLLQGLYFQVWRQ